MGVLSGARSNARCVSESNIPPATEISVTLRADLQPQKPVLQPQGRELVFQYENGAVHFCVDRVDFHNIVEIFE